MMMLSLFFCLAAFLGSYFFGYKLGRTGVAWYVCVNLFFSFLSSLYPFLNILNGYSTYVEYGYWLKIGVVSVRWLFVFDSLSCPLICLVTFVSFLIHCYSVAYMSNDPHLTRFLAFLSLFTMFMIFLVSANNFLCFFFAWEGVGICSYLLISFWYTRRAAVNAALEAVAFNRVGDLALFLAILLLANYTGSLDFITVFSFADVLAHTPFYGFSEKSFFSILDLINVLIFIGVIAKSAQLGLHVWLPDAMEGPTPVSALLHSSTMVVAGVFVLLRCSFMFEHSPLVLNLVAFVGAVTAFFAASIGLVQNDIKKVIAYSTCSQLGYMVFACGFSAYSISFYHLFNHAFFKSLLFLAAGAVIHALDDEQDMRKMGGLISLLPFVYAVTLIGSFSLSGFPFLSGFYSKDAILEVVLNTDTKLAWFCASLGLSSAFLTSFYSFRLLYLTFLSEPRYSYTKFKMVHEPPLLMAVPLFFLAVLSIFSGYFFKDLFIGVGTDYWSNALFTLPFSNHIYFEFLPFSVRFLPVAFSFLGLFFSYMFYTRFYNIALSLLLSFPRFYSFFSRKWYFDFFWFYLSRYFLIFAYQISFKVIDQGLLPYLGPQGIKRLVVRLARLVFSAQSGFIFHYLILFIFGFVLLFIFLFDFTFFWKASFLTLLFGIFFSSVVDSPK